MSDKHAPSGGTAQQQQQWNKPTLKPAHISSQLSPGHLYGPTSGLPIYGGISPTNNAHQVDGLPPYAAARFQAPPPILNHVPPQPQQQQQPQQHQTASLTTPETSTGDTTTTTITTPLGFFSNVPVHPSGFVAPPFSPATTATPNPNPIPFPVTNSGVVQFPPLKPYEFEPPLPNVPLSLTANASGQQVTISPNNVTAALATPNAATTATTRPHVGALDQPSPISGAITATITENVLKAIGVPTGVGSGTCTTGRFLNMGVKPPDPEKLRRIHEMVEASVSEHAKQQIVQVLERVATLKPIERLLLYLRLPGEAPETDPLRQPQNPLGTRSEINHTINWVRSHLQHDPQVSIPKQDVYDDYTTYCERMEIKPLSTADFGKVMKQVFPGIRPRRLGTRGHSRYCYAAMRKTTALPPPQLPHLPAVAETVSVGGPEQKTESGSSGVESPWAVVKEWAEQLLNVKVSNVQELAERIRAAPSSRSSGGPKKYTPREPKEKRTPTDMGPLKKRRKKKRKGSSSSESSTSQMRFNNTTTNNNNNNNNNIDEGNKSTSCHPVIEQIEIKVKEEIESPKMQKLQTPHELTGNDHYLFGAQSDMMPMNLAPEQRSVLAKGSSLLGISMPSHPGVRNLTPHILAMPSSQPAPNIEDMPPEPLASPSTSTTVLPMASPLTPQAMNIKEEVIDDYNPSNIICKKVRKAQQTKGFWQSNAATPSGVAAVAGTMAMPDAIVTTSATPPPTVVVTAPTVIATGSAGSPMANFLMGPPAQLGTLSTSPSNLTLDGGGGSGGGNGSNQGSSGNSGSSSSSSVQSVGGGNGHCPPRVLSRNMLQLMAKRAAAMAAAASASGGSSGGDGGNAGSDPTVPAADLPGDLGLPRERVISICNMDKHELDEYLPETVGDVGENSQDQEAELLQYFQVGDAEGKLNSLDAAKQNRTPTVAVTKATTSTMLADNDKVCVVELKQEIKAEPERSPEKLQSSLTTDHHETTPTSLSSAKSSTVTTTATTTTTSVSSTRSTPVHRMGRLIGDITKITSIPPVGSASASLTLMSQKHQEQEKQQQQQQQHQQLQNPTTPGNKRKINQLLYCSRPVVSSDTFVVRKNSTFLPISPNINTTPNMNPALSWGVGSCPIKGPRTGMSLSNGGYFASPDLSRLRAKPSFGKQQSLDFDPMIGAGTHQSQRFTPVSRLSYNNNNSNNNTTSASAPPSPSVMHQKQHQQQQQNVTISFFRNPSQVRPPPTTSATGTPPPLNDHNSMDLDIFAAESSGDAPTYGFAGLDSDLLINETQRSRSVPLSQLQRRHSPDFNRSFPMSAVAANGEAYSSACNSITPTPVPVDFGDSTFYSESSNSQQSIANIGGENGSLAAELGLLQPDMDMSEILRSTDFDTKFTSLSHGHNTATTTCSSWSAGSSSGYSSVTRSVPSTPLPHHRQNLFGRNYNGAGGNSSGGGCGVRRLLQVDDDFQKITDGGGIKYTGGFSGGTVDSLASGCGLPYGSRCIYDNSKSMPATPITTPSFRYSPTHILINGSTLDSFTASISTCDPDMIINTLHGDSGGGAVDVNRPASPFSRVANELLKNL